MTRMTRPNANWQPPRGLDRTRPREIRLTGNSIALLAGIAGLLIGSVAVFVILFGVAKQQGEEQRLLREEGSDAQAVVTRLWRGSGESKPGWVSYSFAPNSRDVLYQGSAKIPMRLWRNLQAGTTIAVRFVSAHPEINLPLAVGNRATPIWLAPLTAMTLIATAGLLTLPLRKQRFLLTEGRPAPGRVTGLKKTHNGTVVQYEYQVLSGAMRTGRGEPMRKPPGVGSHVVVIYDPDNPRKHALYPLSLVRLRREG
jgi:hypothetical protein